MRRLLVLGGALTAVLATAAVAFAVTTGEWEARASRWLGSSCTPALLASKESSTTNERVALCYALSRGGEDHATIAALESKIAKLEATEPAPPLDFAFFNATTGTGNTYSAVLDAGRYRQIAFTLHVQGEARVEVSEDQEHWTEFHWWSCTPSSYYPETEGSGVCPVVARYYRVKAIGGPWTVTYLAHLTS